MWSNERTAAVIATSGGVGYIPLAPGTFGALVGFILSILCIFISTDDTKVSILLISAIVISYLAGVWSCRILKNKWGDDPSRVVIDETMGYWVGILFLPLDWRYYLAAFVLFRFFDIVKPLGIKKIDRLHNAHSVMLDDLAAGIYTNVVLQIYLILYV